MINLMHGDCLELMKNIPDGSVDMCLTDPPYGITACKWDSVIPFEPMWDQLKRIVKPSGAICLFGSEPFSSHLRISNIKMFKYDWIWEKSKAANILQAKYAPMKAHEIISVFGSLPCVFTKKGESLNYFPNMEQGKPYDKGVEKRKHIDVFSKPTDKWEITGHKMTNKKGFRYPRSVQYFRTAESEGKYSPTQKPVPLLEYLIKTYTLEGETVLDFTMGSGSTGVACKNLNRKFIGIEKDKEYFEIAKERIENA